LRATRSRRRTRNRGLAVSARPPHTRVNCTAPGSFACPEGSHRDRFPPTASDPRVEHCSNAAIAVRATSRGISSHAAAPDAEMALATRVNKAAVRPVAASRVAVRPVARMSQQQATKAVAAATVGLVALGAAQSVRGCKWGRLAGRRSAPSAAVAGARADLARGGALRGLSRRGPSGTHIGASAGRCRVGAPAEGGGGPGAAAARAAAARRVGVGASRKQHGRRMRAARPAATRRRSRRPL
jgi:hypothetical protein